MLDVLKQYSQDPVVEVSLGVGGGSERCQQRAVTGAVPPALLGAVPHPQTASSSSPQVAETCQLAVKRLEWLQEHGEEPSASPYQSVDPAPPAEERDVAKLREALLDEALPLFDRYRAMFALRNLGGRDAVLALADGKGPAGAARCLLPAG